MILNAASWLDSVVAAISECVIPCAVMIVVLYILGEYSDFRNRPQTPSKRHIRSRFDHNSCKVRFYQVIIGMRRTSHLLRYRCFTYRYPCSQLGL